MIPELAKRAAEVPRNRASGLFKRLVIADLLGGVLVTLLSYGCGLMYVYFRQNLYSAGGAPITRTLASDIFMRDFILNSPLYVGVFLLFYTAGNWLFGRYAQRRNFGRFPQMFASVVNGMVMMVGVWFYTWLMKITGEMRGFYTVIVLAQIPVSVIVGVTSDALVRIMFARGRMRKAGAVLVGEGPVADKALEESEAGNLGAYKVLRRVPAPENGADMRGYVARMLDETPDAEAVFVFGGGINGETMMELVVECALAGKYVKITMPVYENAVLIRHDWLGGERVIHFDHAGDAAEFGTLRRIISGLAAAVAAVPVFVPHFIITALIHLDSPGRAVFRQERFGRLGKKFTMYKYRTMFDDAEIRRDELKSYNENDGGLFKIKTDPRITKLGRWLRKSSVDELPQVLNILRGDMRFVGPRPLPCYDLDGYENRWQSARFLVKPGITGLWQVAGRAHVKFDEMCKMDIWYALNRSLRLDLILLWQTIKSVVFGVGAY